MDTTPDDTDTDTTAAAPKGKGKGKGDAQSAPRDAPQPRPDVLVYNAARGVRQCTHSAQIDGTDPVTKLPRYHLTTVALLPGLNLVPADRFELVQADVEGTADVQVYGTVAELDRMHPSSAKVLIDSTGSVECLTALAHRVKSERIAVMVQRQLAAMTADPGKTRVAAARAAHTARPA